MLQSGARRDLTKKPVHAKGGSQLGPQHLQRDSPMMLEVLRQVDGRHPAPAKLALNQETIAQSGLKTIDHTQESAPCLRSSQSGADSRRIETDVCQY